MPVCWHFWGLSAVPVDGALPFGDQACLHMPLLLFLWEVGGGNRLTQGLHTGGGRGRTCSTNFYHSFTSGVFRSTFDDISSGMTVETFDASPSATIPI